MEVEVEQVGEGSGGMDKAVMVDDEIVPRNLEDAMESEWQSSAKPASV